MQRFANLSPAAQLDAALKRKRRRFKAEWTTDVRGGKHRSKAEAAWFNGLIALEEAGEISALEAEPAFEIRVAPGCPHCAAHGVRVGAVKADARFRRGGATIVQDFKGYEGETPLSAFKRKLAAAIHGVEIELVGAGKKKGRPTRRPKG